MSVDSTSVWWSAARQGDVETLKALLTSHPEAAAWQADDACTALHYAAFAGAEDAVSLLLKSGSDPNAQDATGHSPLHYAAFAGHDSVFLLLTQAGSDPAAVDDSLTTMLHAAAAGGDESIVNAVLAEGIGADTANLYGELPVHRAAQRNRLDIVKQLLALGNNAHPSDRYGMSLLHKAAIGGAVETAMWLLDQGFDATLGDRVGDAPLHSAASLGRLEMVKAFLNRGLPVDVRNHEDATPLHHATAAGHNDVVTFLLQFGANSSAVDALGRTPLHAAAIRGHADVIACLNAAQALLDLEDTGKRRAVDLAALYGRTRAWEALASRQSKAHPQLTPTDTKAIINRPIAHGELMAWYLGHSGWAVRTKGHLFVLDYAPGEPEDEESSLLNGRIDPEEWGALTVIVLTSHHHADHFDRRTLQWEHTPLRRVYGWDAPQALPGFRFTDQEFKQIGNVVIASIPATDAGSAFLIEADGVSFYHAGDHAAGQIPIEPEFSEGVEWLADQFAPIQAAFLPIFGCGLPSPETLREGNAFTIEQLKPEAVFPMHIGWTSAFYRQFGQWIRESDLNVGVGIPDQHGDRFRVRHGIIEQVWT